MPARNTATATKPGPNTPRTRRTQTIATRRLGLVVRRRSFALGVGQTSGGVGEDRARRHEPGRPRRRRIGVGAGDRRQPGGDPEAGGGREGAAHGTHRGGRIVEQAAEVVANRSECPLGGVDPRFELVEVDATVGVGVGRLQVGTVEGAGAGDQATQGAGHLEQVADIAGGAVGRRFEHEAQPDRHGAGAPGRQPPRTPAGPARW